MLGVGVHQHVGFQVLYWFLIGRLLVPKGSKAYTLTAGPIRPTHVSSCAHRCMPSPPQTVAGIGGAADPIEVAWKPGGEAGLVQGFGHLGLQRVRLVSSANEQYAPL